MTPTAVTERTTRRHRSCYSSRIAADKQRRSLEHWRDESYPSNGPPTSILSLPWNTTSALPDAADAPLLPHAFRRGGAPPALPRDKIPHRKIAQTPRKAGLVYHGGQTVLRLRKRALPLSLCGSLNDNRMSRRTNEPNCVTAGIDVEFYNRRHALYCLRGLQWNYVC